MRNTTGKIPVRTDFPADEMPDPGQEGPCLLVDIPNDVSLEDAAKVEIVPVDFAADLRARLETLMNAHCTRLEPEAVQQRLDDIEPSRNVVEQAVKL